MFHRYNLAKTCAALLLAASLAPVARAEQGFDPQALAAAAPGTSVRAGDSRVNGVDMPASVISGFPSADELFASLERACKERCTVTRAETDMSQVFIVADVESAMCPKCRKLTKESAEKIVFDSYTISYITVGDTAFGFGSPSGKLLETMVQRKELRYEGDLFKPEAKDLDLLAQSQYRFEHTESTSFSATMKGKVAVVRARLGAALARAGYKRISSDAAAPTDGPSLSSGVPAESTRTIFKKGSSTAQLEVSALANEADSLVVFNAVQSP